MSKLIVLNSRAWNYNDIDYWTDMARELKRGFFDCLFIADVVDVYRGSAGSALNGAAQEAVDDPFGAISAMAAVTRTSASASPPRSPSSRRTSW